MQIPIKQKRTRSLFPVLAPILGLIPFFSINAYFSWKNQTCRFPQEIVGYARFHSLENNTKTEKNIDIPNFSSTNDILYTESRNFIREFHRRKAKKENVDALKPVLFEIVASHHRYGKSQTEGNFQLLDIATELADTGEVEFPKLVAKWLEMESDNDLQTYMDYQQLLGLIALNNGEPKIAVQHLLGSVIEHKRGEMTMGPPSLLVNKMIESKKYQAAQKYFELSYDKWPESKDFQVNSWIADLKNNRAPQQDTWQQFLRQN